MKKIKVMSIFGTRPEATKMAPLVKALSENACIDSVVCVTAQHRQMLDQVLELFNIVPDYDLNIMKHGQSVSDITVAVLKGLETVIAKEQPDMVLVHGDTSTTFAGALAAFYSKVCIGHVEAGLRTYDKYQPFPEEMNRVLTTGLADVHFAPTQCSKNNLLKENIDDATIFITGNTAVDCLHTTVLKNYRFKLDALDKIDYENKRVIAMTAHRRENLGQPLDNICAAVLKIVNEHDDVEVVYAVHQNPAIQAVATKTLGNHPRIHLTPPLDMSDMHNLLNRAHLVMTDSGGLQEEAPGLNKPVLVLRNVTERPEGLEAGTLVLCGVETDDIVTQTNKLLNDQATYDKMAHAKNPFGDGAASKRIVEGILYHFGVLKVKPADF